VQVFALLRVSVARKCVAKGSTKKKNFHNKDNEHDQLKGGYFDPLIIDANIKLIIGYSNAKL